MNNKSLYPQILALCTSFDYVLLLGLGRESVRNNFYVNLISQWALVFLSMKERIPLEVIWRLYNGVMLH